MSSSFRGGARLLRGGGSSLVREIFRGGSRWSAVEKVAPTITERAGLGIGPFASRTPKLPQSATVAEILEHGWIPGREGITLSDGTVRFADLYRMTEAHGIEFGLTREVVDGKSVYRLYSGGRNAVTMPSGEGVRIIGHTHPSGYRLPSTADIDNLNRAFLNSLERDLLAPVPHRRVIWGSGPANSTIYYPNVLR